MSDYRFISINTVLAKYYRDARGNDLNETDLIEWAGEALDFMKIPTASEEALAFLKVKDHHAPLPNNLHYIIQIARDMDEELNQCLAPSDVLLNSDIEDTIPIVRDCDGNVIESYSIASTTPYFDIKYNYEGWANNGFFRRRFVPVRLANHTLFNTLVCSGIEEDHTRQTGEDEYTIVGDAIRFSFKEGFVAVPYIRQKLDEKGMPMIPDNGYAKAAINYYIIWKMKERECWNHREGSCQLAEKAQMLWNDYIKKFKNHAKMPKGVDQHQNLMEGSRYLIPRLKRYYGFFGKLGTKENRPFNEPRDNYRSSYGQRIDADTGTNTRYLREE